MRAFGIINNAWHIITEYPYKTFEEAKKEVDELNASYGDVWETFYNVFEITVPKEIYEE